MTRVARTKSEELFEQYLRKNGCCFGSELDSPGKEKRPD